MSDHKQPVFRYEPARGYEPSGKEATECKHFVVYVTLGAGEAGGEDERCLCDVQQGYQGRWSVRETWRNHDESADDMYGLSFNDKEQAAVGFYWLSRRLGKIATARPLPIDVAEYLKFRNKALTEEKQALEMQLLNLRFERYRLKQFADANGLEHLSYRLADSDPQSVVRELLDFKVSVKLQEDDDEFDEDKPFGENQYAEFPFFSEAALYNLIGKDDARSVLMRIRDVCKMLAPGETEGL